MDQEQLQKRIAQWEKMAEADPANSMGWFSLGNAYKDAEMAEPAARALRKAIELDKSLSRAYQLLAQVLIKQEINDQAGDILTRGYVVAAKQGDVMPQRAMGSLLEKLGLPIPEIKSTEVEAPAPVGENAIKDRRTGKVGTRMGDQPMRGPVGKFIKDHYSQETWREWIAMGTKVINELRLDFSRVDHQQTYEKNMLEWLGISDEEIQEYAKQG